LFNPCRFCERNPILLRFQGGFALLPLYFLLGCHAISTELLSFLRRLLSRDLVEFGLPGDLAFSRRLSYLRGLVQSAPLCFVSRRLLERNPLLRGLDRGFTLPPFFFLLNGSLLGQSFLFLPAGSLAL
jgi:hypothetical protein